MGAIGVGSRLQQSDGAQAGGPNAAWHGEGTPARQDPFQRQINASNVYYVNYR